MEIRQITADERTDTMFPLQAYAFEASPWPETERDDYARRMQYHRTTVNLIAEEEGRTLASVAALAMRQNVRGVVHDMAGIASVTTHPTARRRGFVRQLLTRLLQQMREQGCTVSSLYPFRPSFYGRFGYVGLPRIRTATFEPAGLAHLVRADLPGTVDCFPLREAFDAYDGLTLRLLGERHGFSVFDETRTSGFRDNPLWVAVARADGEVVGAVTYRIDGFGGELIAGDLLVTGALGRALLLQFFSRHVDQVAKVTVKIGVDEVPELWGSDLEVVTQGRVGSPGHNGPMARLLSVDALTGTPTAARESITVEVVEDEFIAGSYLISGDGGHLVVEPGKNEPQATLTCAGLSALAFGVLDPMEIVTRGLGQIDEKAPLEALFPKKMPYVFSDF